MADHRVTHQVASWCLSYPDETLVAQVPQLRAAVSELDEGEIRVRMLRFLDHLETAPLDKQQNEYVDTFDMTKRHALHLSYWTDGDTRRRGEVLAYFKQKYRDTGFLVATGGELPDHLTIVLEYAAVADPIKGTELLQEYRASIELLRMALEEDESPYVDVITAICRTLPGPSPKTRSDVMAMVGLNTIQPTESVGLEPYDARLLPLAGEVTL